MPLLMGWIVVYVKNYTWKFQEEINEYNTLVMQFRVSGNLVTCGKLAFISPLKHTSTIFILSQPSNIVVIHVLNTKLMIHLIGTEKQRKLVLAVATFFICFAKWIINVSIFVYFLNESGATLLMNEPWRNHDQIILQFYDRCPVRPNTLKKVCRSLSLLHGYDWCIGDRTNIR